MTLLNFKSKQEENTNSKEVRPFRSEVQSSIVIDTKLETNDFTGLRPDGVKVSEYRLEQYLNACSPTCHG
ncbi:MAG TPA: hypothetical protein VGC97_23190 [Pyrinomonadaceae bacterium]